jgi:hypothetical protein
VARGVNGNYFPAAVPTEDGVHFTVRTPDLRATIERVWSAGGEVVRVNPVRRSLEDIFVELTTGEEKPTTD